MWKPTPARGRTGRIVLRDQPNRCRVGAGGADPAGEARRASAHGGSALSQNHVAMQSFRRMYSHVRLAHPGSQPRATACSF